MAVESNDAAGRHGVQTPTNHGEGGVCLRGPHCVIVLSFALVTASLMSPGELQAAGEKRVLTRSHQSLSAGERLLAAAARI